ncbi:MAG: flagellar basal body-associated FliL family protein [Spirochaetales bacterium]
MSDPNDMFDTDDDVVGAEESTGGGQKRVGFLGGMLIQVLKWVGIILGAIIFIVTVVVIAVNFLTNANAGQTRIPVAEEYEAEAPVYQWYSQIGELRGVTADEVRTSYIITPHLGYDQENEDLTTELIARRLQFVDIFGQYFGGRTSDELVGVENRARAEAELLNAVNRILRSGQVRDIVFEDYQFLPF